VLVALALSVSVIVVGRDVSVQAAHSNANRASLNRTFAVLSRSILVDENRFDHQAATLLAEGAGWSRDTLAARVGQLRLEGRQLRQRAGLLAQPVLDDGVQATLITVTDLRVDAVARLTDRLAAALQLPHHGPAGSVGNAHLALARSNHLWAAARRALRRAPGAARLARSVAALARAPLASQLAALAAAGSLRAVRAAAIRAVEVTPAPFPAPRGHLVLPPVTVGSIEVSIANEEYVDQPFSVHLTITPSSAGAPAVTRSAHGTLGPLGARAVSFAGLPLTPGESAVVNIWLTRTPVPSAHAGRRSYELAVAPAPTS
jgi:hypothetical protein